MDRTTLSLGVAGAAAALTALWLWRHNLALQAELQQLRALEAQPQPAARGPRVSFADPPESTPRSGAAVRSAAPSAAAAAASAAAAPLPPQQQQQQLQQLPPTPTARKPRRIYMDGCFDMLHYGHANALRQAKKEGDVLVVGLVNDEEIVVNKGTPPVMCEAERYAALAACKFVDEIIRDAPYNLHKDWVDRLVAAHGITFILHGDDPCFTADGQDAYAYAKQIGVYKQIKRTEGVSTTDIVGRMLLMTREHHVPPPPSAALEEEGDCGDGSGRVSPVSSIRSVRSSTLAQGAGEEQGPAEGEEGEQEGASGADLAASTAAASAAVAAATDGRRRQARLQALLSQLPSTHSRFLPTARRIMQFAEGRVPTAADKVVYMPGSWDVFNPGHIAALAAARQQGTFLLVGIYDDTTINKLKGHGLPILNLYERALIEIENGQAMALELVDGGVVINAH